MGWSNQNVTLIILSEQVTGYSGMFGYSPAPGAGTLIFSIAAAAGTDPYGNTYPAGLSTSAGASTITGTDYVINSDGIFFYSAAPALNTLALSVTQANVTDAYGNLALAGFTTYVKSGVIYLAAQNSSAGLQWFEANSMAGPWGVFTAKITADQSGNLTINGNSVVSFPSLINGNTVSWAFLGAIGQLTHTGNCSKSGVGTIGTTPTAAEFNALNTAYNNTVDTINNGILAKLQSQGFMA